MEGGSKEEEGLNLAEVKTVNLGKAFEKLQSQASGLVTFALQWRDLEDHLMTLKGNVEKRFIELQNRSIEIDERAKVVEAGERRLGDLEVKADGFRKDIEVKEEELSGIKMLIEECTMKQRLMMESLREIQGELDLKGGLLAEREADLERHCVEISEEMENLRKAQALRRELIEENDRKTRELTLVQEMLETRSLELTKTQVEIDSKGAVLAKMEADLERHCVEMSSEMEHLGRAQALRRELDDENERKTRDLTMVQEKVAECGKMLETSSLELTRTQRELDLKTGLLAQLEVDLERLRVEMNSGMSRAETCRRELDKEIKRKERDLTLVQDKVVECGKQLETRSLELAKTQSELDLKGEELAQLETDIQRHRVEMSSEMGRAETRRRKLDKEIEGKTNELTLVQDKVSECGKLLETRSLELAKTQGELDLKVEQLEQVKIDFGRHHSELTAEMEHLERIQTRNREFEEVIEMKRKDLAEVLNRTVECGEMLETRSLELTKTQAELDLKVEQLEQIKIEFERRQSELTAEMEHLGRTQTRNRDLEEVIEMKRKDLAEVLDRTAKCGKLLETRSLELLSKEKELQALNLDLDLREEMAKSLNNEMEETCQKMESKAKELEAIERLISERSGHCESIKLLIEEHTEELASKEKRHDEITEAIHKLSLEIALKEDTLTERNKQDEELIRQLEVRQEQLSSINEAIRECTCELEAKRKHRDQVQSSITDLTAVLESVEKKIQESLKSTEEQQVKLKASLMEHEKGLELKEKELIAREERVNEQDQKLKATEQELTKWVEDCEVKAKQLSNFCQQNNQDQSRKRRRYDDKSLSQSRDEGLDGAIKSLDHVLTSCTTGQENTYNFENERSPDKFQIDQIWAVYSDSDIGMPRKYAQIKRIDTSPELKLHVAPLVLYRPPPPNLTTHPVCCGRFKLKIGKAEVLVPSSFSHKVNAVRSSINRFEVYPGKGEIWALYKNCAETGEEVEIVEIVETDEKSIQAMLLTAKVFNKFLYGRCLETKAGVVEIPKTEVNRFSHQIPAFRRVRRATRPGDCEWWELDSKAVLDLNSKKP